MCSSAEAGRIPRGHCTALEGIIISLAQSLEQYMFHISKVPVYIQIPSDKTHIILGLQIRAAKSQQYRLYTRYVKSNLQRYYFAQLFKNPTALCTQFLSLHFTKTQCCSSIKNAQNTHTSSVTFYHFYILVQISFILIWNIFLFENAFVQSAAGKV